MAALSGMRLLLWAAGLTVLSLGGCEGRIHQLQLNEEKRSTIQVNSFGFFANGALEVNVSRLHFSKAMGTTDGKPIGFSLSRARIGQFLSSTEQELDECILETKPVDNLLLILDFRNSRVKVEKVGNLKKMQIFPGLQAAEPAQNLEQTPRDASPSTTASKGQPELNQKEKTLIQKRDTVNGQPEPNNTADKAKAGDAADKAKAGDAADKAKAGDAADKAKAGDAADKAKAGDAADKAKAGDAADKAKADDAADKVKANSPADKVKPGEISHQSSGSVITVKSDVKAEHMFLPLKEAEGGIYNFTFHIVFSSAEEGLYNLYFHNCRNIQAAPVTYNITVLLTERNPGGYLSAAEIPLFKLYLIMAGSFFTSFIIWVYVLHKHKFSVFKIHWLMAALVFTKSISLLFHSINYYFINTEGRPIESLAVMYYITHVLKGVLLFITIVLIGTGWAFVKYILSDKDKKIFMIVLPLQVLANVAYIIIESSETGTSDYALWKQIVFLVDLICCGAILFPVIWSIRHLQEASSTDGKAAMNLAKLKLFRHYYIMIVCYIYFTRIIAILLQVTVSFQLQWLHEMLVEVSTLVFFVLTGYKFRPACNNPYLQLPQEDEDMQMDEVVTESAVLEGVSRVNKMFNGPETL